MYHYQKNIGDYRSATMHFSLLEHGIYNQLLDWYYLEETPITSDNPTLFRRLSARTDEEQKAVLLVLEEMFFLADDGWRHKRVEREIEAYRAKADHARKAGKLGGRPKKTTKVISENQGGFENKPNPKPTKNQEPLTNNQKPKDQNTSADLKEIPELTLNGDPPPDDLRQRFEKFWLDFPSDLGSKGSKAEALSKFLKLKPDDILLATMRRALTAQARHKRECRAKGEFAENFPHVVRWLSKRRWEDELTTSQPNEPRELIY